MRNSTLTRSLLVASVAAAGTFGLYAVNAAAADTDNPTSSDTAASGGQSDKLGERVEKFNESGGSLNANSKADSDLDNNKVTPYTSDEQRARDEEIGRDVSEFNENRGSLNPDSAATSKMDEDAKNAPYTTDEQRARDEQIGKDVNRFNEQGGSLNSDSAASPDLDDNTDSDQ